jgi:hypothetical protein
MKMGIISITREEFEKYSHLAKYNEGILDFLREKLGKNISKYAKADFYESFHTMLSFLGKFSGMLNSFYFSSSDFFYGGEDEKTILKKIYKLISSVNRLHNKIDDILKQTIVAKKIWNNAKKIWTTVEDCAKFECVSRQAIYSRIKKNWYECKEVNGIKMVRLSNLSFISIAYYQREQNLELKLDRMRKKKITPFLPPKRS